jgi:hypothetical protein
MEDQDSPTTAEDVSAENREDKSSGELGGVEAVEASEYAREHPLPLRTDAHQQFIPGATRDQLIEAQSRATGAAHLSGEHVAGLIYSRGSVGQHTAPYDARYEANYGEATREPDQKDTAR